MKVQKFSPTALIKILNHENADKGGAILSARDSWLRGENGKHQTTKYAHNFCAEISEKDDLVILEISNRTYRISGDLVSLEEAI